MSRPRRQPAAQQFARVVRKRAISDPFDSILTLCARPTMPEALVPELERRVAAVSDWSAILTLAEEHGLGPLLYKHLVRGRIGVSPGVERRLRGIYARHRGLNDVLFRALRELLDAMRGARIDVLVLKGPAIVELVYGDRGFRPISDLDLLVPEHQAARTQYLLGELGFDVTLPTSTYRMRRHHHLHGASRVIDGVPVVVEVHRDALSVDRSPAMSYEAHVGRATRFDVDGTQGLRFGPNDMLWHLCRHLVGLWHPIRLIWVADIIGYAERMAETLDWEELRRRRPFVISALELLHHVTSLPPTVIERAQVRLVPPPADVAKDYVGWPRATALAWDGWRHRVDFARTTLVPPEWWLRLNYGAGISASGRWVASRRHLASLGGIAWRRFVDFLPRADQAPDLTGN